MTTIANPSRRGCRNRGLATLELVLSLPILLLVMALMINFGTVASWKVRALGVARYSLWEHRLPRSTANFPHPTCWPPAAQMGTAALPPAPELDGPRANLLVPVGFLVGSDIMDPTVELLQGSAHLTRQFPLLRSLGHYDLNAQTELLDNTWDFQRMGLATNTSFRIPLVYTLPPAPNQAAWAQAYSNARQAILNMLFPLGMATPGPLWPLDRDEEFISYGALSGWGTGAPDFHPRLQAFCSLDRQEADVLVKQLIDRIQGDKNRGVPGVARQMTQAFINLYTRAIQAYQAQHVTPPPQLQQNIIVLNQFLQTL